MLDIIKIYENIYTNYENIWIILEFKGVYDVEKENIKELFSFLSDKKLDFSVNVFKYKDKKRYFLEIFSGLKWNINNSASTNQNYNKTIQLFLYKLENILNQPILKNNVKIVKDFYLYNNQKLDEMFWNKKWTENNDFISSKDKKEIKEIEKIMNKKMILPFLTNDIEAEENEKYSDFSNFVIKKILNNNYNFKQSKNFEIVDSFLGEKIWDWNIFAGNQNMFSLQLFIKDKISSRITWNSKDYYKYGEYKKEELLKLLDENFSKYYYKEYFKTSKIAISNNIKILDEQDNTIEANHNVFKYPENLENETFVETGINLFVFSNDIWIMPKIMTKLENFWLVVDNYDAIRNNLTTIQDPFFTGTNNFITLQTARNLLARYKKVLHENNGITFWREYFSNNNIKYYPHNIAGVDEQGLIQQSHHWIIVGKTWSGKTYYVAKIFQQLWKDRTKAFFLDPLNVFEQKLLKFVWWNGDFEEYQLKKSDVLEDTDNDNEKIIRTKPGEGRFYITEDWQKIEDDERWNLKLIVKTKNWYYNYVWKNNWTYTYDKETNEIIFVWWKGDRNISDDKTSVIEKWEGKGVYKKETPYFVFDLYDWKYNFIWRISDNEKERNLKVNIILTILGVDNIENDSIKDYIKEYLKKYLNNLHISNKIFNFNDFKKNIIKELEENSWFDKTIIETIKNSLEGTNPNIVKSLNSEEDLYKSLLEKEDKIIFNAKNTVEHSKWFAILTLDVFRLFLTSERNYHKYGFVDEVSARFVNKYGADMEVMFDTIIKEVRNFNSGVYLISQSLADFKNFNLSQISEFFLLSEDNVSYLQNSTNEVKDDETFAEYAEDYKKIQERYKLFLFDRVWNEKRYFLVNNSKM